MKKFFAVFASLAVAAIFCMGLAACGGTNGDKSVTTKEEWDKALNDTYAATNYSMKSHMKKTLPDGSVHEHSADTDVDLDKLIMGGKYELKTTEGGKVRTLKSEAYVEIADGMRYNYELDDDSEDAEDAFWQAESLPAGQNEIEDFKNENKIKSLIGGLSDNFEDHTYDEKTHTYTFEEQDESLDENYTISFRNGRIYRVYVEINDDEGLTTFEYLITYGKAKVNIPKKAKDALNK